MDSATGLTQGCLSCEKPSATLMPPFFNHSQMILDLQTRSCALHVVDARFLAWPVELGCDTPNRLLSVGEDMDREWR